MTDNEKIDLLKSTVEYLYTKESRSIRYIAKILNLKERDLKDKIKEWEFVKADEKHIKPSIQKNINTVKHKIIDMLNSDCTNIEISKETNIPGKVLSKYFLLDEDIKQANLNKHKRMEEKYINTDNKSIEILHFNYNIEPIEGEIWKDILGFDEYQVSNYGRIRKYTTRYKKYYEIIPVENCVSKRLYVDLKSNGVRKNIQLSRLVGHAFVDGYSEINNTINHIDGDIHNNKASNLEWVSQAINNQKAFTDLKRKKSVQYNKYGKFKKIVLDGKYEFKTLAALIKFLGKSSTQVYRYIDGICKSEHTFEFIY